MTAAVTGAAWLGVPDAPEFSLFLFVLSLLGASALAAAGLWQSAAGPKTRVFVLVLLAALSGGYVAANTIGVLVTGATFLPGLSTVRSAHWVGLVVGALLYLLSLAQGLGALKERDRALDPEA